ncbi:MAG: hypothetical protein FJ104_04865 [Deltaproteobacteria bacterium]|nr:hypothetical protein [Deltaproteobacteria bacterium]
MSHSKLSLVPLTAVVALACTPAPATESLTRDADAGTGTAAETPAGALVLGPTRELDSLPHPGEAAFRRAARGFLSSGVTQTTTFDGDRFELTPREPGAGDRAAFAFRTARVARGERELSAPRQVDADEAGVLHVAGGEYAERVTPGAGGVEQEWLFDTRPEGQGPLLVHVETSGMAHVGVTPGGHHFQRGDARVAYGPAVFVDAAGERTPVETTFDAASGALGLTIPAEVLDGAAYPARLDPTVTAEADVDVPAIGASGSRAVTPAVARIGTQALVVWTDSRVGSSTDIFALRVDAATGAPLDTAAFAVSTRTGNQSTPAVVAHDGGYLVAYLDGTATIRVASASTSGVVTDGGIAATGGTLVHPRLASSGTTALLVYDEAGEVRAARNTGGGFAAPVAIAATAAVEEDPAVAAGPGGEFLVAWTEGTTGADIRAAIVAADGTVGTAFGVAVNAATLQRQAAASHDGTSYWVAWANTVGSARDIYAARVTSGGAVLDSHAESAVTVGGAAVTTAAGLQNEPSIACQTGGCFVAWQDSASGAMDARGKVLAPDFTALSGELTLSAAADVQAWPEVAVAEGGAFYVAWEDARNGAPPYVYGSPVTLAGSVVDAGGRFLTLGTPRQRGPAAAFVTGQSYRVAWADSRAPGDDILTKSVTKAGAVVGASLRTLGGAAGRQDQPAGAAFGSTYLFAWADQRAGGARDLYAGRMDLSGNPLDGSGLLISAGANEQIEPAVASSGTRALVVWQDRRSGTSDIYGAILDDTLAVVAPEFVIANAALNQQVPAVGHDDVSGLFVVAWRDGRVSDASSDIYAARVDTSGTVLDPGGIAVGAATGVQTDPAVDARGGRALVAWEDSRSGNADIRVALLAPSGGSLSTVLADTALASRTTEETDPAVAHIGDSFVVTWTDARSSVTNGTDVYARQVFPSGAFGTELPVATGTDNERRSAITRGSPLTALIAYEHGSVSVQTERVATRRLSVSSGTGIPCTSASSCATGFCVDGVCCDSACGGGSPYDCQVCSTAKGGAVDGTCGPETAGRVCRNLGTRFCDVVETCDGAGLSCPADVGRRGGEVCDSSCGATCPPSDASGAPHVCPTCP